MTGIGGVPDTLILLHKPGEMMAFAFKQSVKKKIFPIIPWFSDY